MSYSTPSTGDQHGRRAIATPTAVDRRRFLQLAGGSAVAAGAVAWAGGWLTPEEARSAPGAPDLYLGGTDGWMHLPPTPAIPPFHPDVLAPALLTTYIFGFRNLTGLTSAQRAAQKNKAQHSAPLFWVPQYDPAHPRDFLVTLTNLGLALRPDLFDAHTLHWHGFRNVIPFFDGEPTGSVSVPSGREFTYAYRPRDPGTYMYHCHVEDVEHVHMGMTGLVFVRPLQDGNTSLYPSGKYLYNDGDGSTGFDREFSMFLSEVWAEAHWADAHIQLPEWSDYHPDFSLLNGRVYPDTIAPNGSVDPFNPVRDAQGDLIAPAGHPELQYQPNSSLITCNSGDRVALRFANLGFREAAMTITGIPMRVIGRDATLMRGRDGTDTSYTTDTLNIGPGESYDVVFSAPPHQGPGDHDTYLLYNRSYVRSANLAPGGYGGQTTEIHVYPNGVAPQGYPNDWGI
jgi:FtsP/CotA-like multicopper oxidase with cupredoxin domain